MIISPKQTVGVSRRALLLAAGGAAAGGLVGCSSNGNSSSASQSNAAKPPSKLPEYIPVKHVPALITSKVPGVDPAAKSYPKPYKTVDKMPPGNGDELSIFTITWGGAVPGVSRNKAWKTLNDVLNVKLNPTITPADSYDQKVATILAGGRLPDIMILNPTPTVNTAMKQGAFANLTDVLGGDKIKQWPNIGWTTTDDWKISSVGGQLYGIPIYVPIANACIRIRADYAKKMGMSPPKNAEEFLHFATELPKAHVAPDGSKAYALGVFNGANTAGPGGSDVINAMFKVPNNWIESGGKLTHAYETTEFQSAMEFAVKVWRAGGFHPNALALASQGSKVLSLFNAGQLGVQTGLNTIGWFQEPYADVVAKAGGASAIAPWVVPSHDGSGPGNYYLGPGIGGWVGISAEVAKDQSKLTNLLNVINWMKAPWGSEEYNTRTYGRKGVDWDFDSHGVPTPKATSTYATEVGTVTYGFRNNVWYQPGQPTVPSIVMPYQEAVVRAGVKDPTAFIPSEVANRVTPILSTLAQEYLNGIVSGKRPLSDLKSFVQQWKAKGGDQLRGSLEQGLTQRNG